MSREYNFVKIICLLTTLAVAAESANILGVFTANSPSHQIVHMSYVKALIERGHNVTVVTTTPLRDVNPRYHHILIPQTEARAQAIVETQKSMKDLHLKNIFQFIKSSSDSLKVIGDVQYDAIKSPKFQELMNNPDNKFDLVMLGYFFNDYHFGLGEHFNCPIIISGTSSTNEFMDRLIGNPPEITYVPTIFIQPQADPKTFWGRLKFFYCRVMSQYFFYLIDQHFVEHYNDLFPAPKYPPIDVAAKRISLILFNTHISENIARPIAPAVIEVGGIQVKEKPDPLPKNLQEIINSAKHGVIYVSFGSNLKSKDLGPEMVKNLYNALSSVKQTVIWKGDESEKPGNSSNIHFVKWLPQDDLLAEEKIKLFVTHAGKGGVAEAQFYGVPMLAIPMFADQPVNAKKLTEDGFGLQLDKTTMTEGTIKWAVSEILENPKYRENVRKFSRLYRDRPMTAKQTALYWIEYVLRHKGAYHMQSPALHLNGFQYFSLDVIGFLLLIAFVVFKVITVSVKFVFRKIVCIKNSSFKESKLKRH